MWTKKRIAASLFSTAFLALGGLQLMPAPPRTNPPVNLDRTLQTSRAVPAHIDSIFRRACMDCHSNETRWPWYSHIAPVSWGVSKDVVRARKAMNLSEWTDQAGRRPGTAISYLTAMCAGVKGERMPPAKYVMLHPESRLSASEVYSLCAWTTEESKRYIQAQREPFLSQVPRQ